MNITIQKSELDRIIRTVQAAVPAKPVDRILSFLRVSVTPDTITVRGTDTEMTIECTGPCKSDKVGGVCIPSHILAGAVGAMQDGTVSIEVGDTEGTVRRAKVSMGRNAYRINCIGTEKFPVDGADDTGHAFRIPSDAFRTMLRQVLHSVCRDKTHHSLFGVHLETDGRSIDCVATDGKTLSMVRREGEFPKMSITLPFKVATELSSIAPSEGDVEMSFNDSCAIFRFDKTNCTIRTKLVDGDFARYRLVLPAPTNNGIEVNRLEFLGAINHVSAISREDTRIKMVVYDNAIILNTEDDEYGAASDEVSVKYDGDYVSISAANSLLSNQLKAMSSDDFVLEVSENRPLVFRDRACGYLGIVMPMRSVA